MFPHCLEVAEHNSIILYPQNLSFVRNNNEKEKKKVRFGKSKEIFSNLGKCLCKSEEGSM